MPVRVGAEQNRILAFKDCRAAGFVFPGLSGAGDLDTGPRQCGKTKLARELLKEDSVNYFDLEDPANLARLDEPMENGTDGIGTLFPVKKLDASVRNGV